MTRPRIHTLPEYTHVLADGHPIRCRLRSVISDGVEMAIVEVLDPVGTGDCERSEAIRAALVWYLREFPGLPFPAFPATRSINFDRTGLVDP